MSNACVARFSGIHKASLIRLFSTHASPSLSLSTALVYPSSFPLNAPQRSDEWFALRKDKLTTSTFNTALDLWKGNRRYELWYEKVYGSDIRLMEGAIKGAIEWGVLKEALAIDRYKSITGRDVGSLGFAIHSEERFDWIGASPDGLLGCCGILEVKCPFNKGKPETMVPWSTAPFYYMPQVQGQMEILDRDWVDLYCWTPNGSTIFRVVRDRSYWELIHRVLREFWWDNVVPAREAFLLGKEDEAKAFKPTSTHKLTGLVIAQSLKLAEESKLLCREIGGDLEFFR